MPDAVLQDKEQPVIAGLFFVLLCGAGALLRLVVVVYRQHINDLQTRITWLYDQNYQQAQRIKELEQQCQ